MSRTFSHIPETVALDRAEHGSYDRRSGTTHRERIVNAHRYGHAEAYRSHRFHTNVDHEDVRGHVVVPERRAMSTALKKYTRHADNGEREDDTEVATVARRRGIACYGGGYLD